MEQGRLLATAGDEAAHVAHALVHRPRLGPQERPQQGVRVRSLVCCKVHEVEHSFW